MGITIKHFFGKKVTEFYPEQPPRLYDRFHGVLSLKTAECTACGTCANVCPNGAIKITGERDESKKLHLTGYKINVFYCMFCGICVENCPRQCLYFSKEFELAGYSREVGIFDLYALGQKETQEQAAGHGMGG